MKPSSCTAMGYPWYMYTKTYGAPYMFTLSTHSFTIRHHLSYLSIYFASKSLVSIYLSTYLSICLSICLSACLTDCLPSYSLICLSIWLTTYLSFSLYDHLSICLCFCLIDCPSDYLSWLNDWVIGLTDSFTGYSLEWLILIGRTDRKRPERDASDKFVWPGLRANFPSWSSAFSYSDPLLPLACPELT